MTDTYDPFGKYEEEFFDLAGTEDIDIPEDPDTEAVERLGLRRICTDCSKEGEPVTFEGRKVIFMDTVEATAAQIYGNPKCDDIDIRTWAVCPECKKIVEIT